MCRLFTITLTAIGTAGVGTVGRATWFLGLDWTVREDLVYVALAAVPYLTLAGAATLCRRRPVMLGMVLAITGLVGILLVGFTYLEGAEQPQAAIVDFGLWVLAVVSAAAVGLACFIVSVAGLLGRLRTRAR